MRKPAIAGLLTAVLLLAGFAAPAAAVPPDDPTDVVVRPCSTDTSICGVLFWNGTGTVPVDVFHVRIILPDGGTRINSYSPSNARFVAARNGGHAEFAGIQTLDPDVVYVYQVRACGPHRDGIGRECSAYSTEYTFEGTFIGDGHVRSVDGDSPGEAMARIRDYALENAPLIRLVLGAIFLVCLTFYLMRRGLAKSRGQMRL